MFANVVFARQAVERLDAETDFALIIVVPQVF